MTHPNHGKMAVCGEQRKSPSLPISRSENMRRIRSRDTLPELMLRRALHKVGKRYRCNVRALPGSPDIVFSRHRLAIFVHGCFWHQHPGCTEASQPKTNRPYWQPKLLGNVERDRRHRQELERLGYKVLVLWECEIERAVSDITLGVIKILGEGAPND